jgi:Protein of unknown function (DUF3710)
MPTDEETEAEFLDLGCLQIPLRPDLEIQVDVDTASDTIISITLVLPQSVASVQVFAAATHEDAWPAVRDGIVAGLAQQHVESKVELGAFGTEIHCVMPTQNDAGDILVQPVRFVGISGPRWFVRATIGGDAATLPEAARVMDDFLASIVVVRGDHAMAPGEPMGFTLPMQ